LLSELYPYAVRCAPQAPPGRHEIGTSQAELFAGLAASVDYWVWLGEQNGADGDRRGKLKGAYRAATDYEAPLTQRLIDGLLETPVFKYKVSRRRILRPSACLPSPSSIRATRPHRSPDLSRKRGSTSGPGTITRMNSPNLSVSTNRRGCYASDWLTTTQPPR
jgi:hypothetical protein